MLTLFHAPQSRSSRIVWLLEEIGAEIVTPKPPTVSKKGARGGTAGPALSG